MRKIRYRTPDWVSLSPSIRDRSSGPISLTVVRIGVPRSPNTSQKHTGEAEKAKLLTPQVFRRSSILAFCSPGLAMPARSPLTSARKTGTPRREKPSASTCRVTVLPVPVAPEIRP